MFASTASDPSIEQRVHDYQLAVAEAHPLIGRIMDGLVARHKLNGQEILAEDILWHEAIHYLTCYGTRSTIIRYTERSVASLPQAMLNQGVIYARNRRDPLLGYDPAVIDRYYRALAERLGGAPTPPIPPVFHAYKQALALFVEIIGALYYLAKRFDPMEGTSHRRQPQPKARTRTLGRSPGMWLPDWELPVHLVVDNVRR